MKTIILYGMRGTGKSTVGKDLASDLAYSFLDLDNFIAEKNAKALPDFIESEGWDSFRDEEHRCLQEVLEQENKDGRVISLGGGTIAFERNRDEIFVDKNTKIVYLDTDLEEIARRISKDEDKGEKRNSLTGKSVLDELEEVYKQRESIYKNSCDFSVDNNGEIKKTIAEIAYKLTWGGICIPITNFSNINEIYDDIRNDRRIEYVELRIDFLHDYSNIEEYIKKCPKKVVCTNRASFEGGEFNGSSEESFNILQKCIKYGADYIDIELKSFEQLSSHLRFTVLTEKLILSHHNFEETPNIRELEGVLDTMRLFSPVVYKITCMPQKLGDVERIHQLIEYFYQNISFGSHKLLVDKQILDGGENPLEGKKIEGRKDDAGFIFISMGEIGISTRIDVPKSGGLLTFGSYGSTASAPGQIDYKELYKSIFNKSELFGKKIENYIYPTYQNLEKLCNKYFPLEGKRGNMIVKLSEGIISTKRVLFLGASQISGSLSPFMHNFSSNLLTTEEKKFFYTLIDVDIYSESVAKNFIQFLESSDKLLGANITMPYKIDAYKYLKEQKCLDEKAVLVGAVNTLYKKEGKIRGTNTDIDGIISPIQQKLGNKIQTIECCYILGSGGAARAAIGAAIKMGISNIYVLSRGQESLDEVKEHFSEYLGENQKLITQIYDVEVLKIFPFKKSQNKAIIINTLPFGFKDNLPKSPIEFGELERILPHISLYYEAVYDAEKGDTPLVDEILKYKQNLNSFSLTKGKDTGKADRDNQEIKICRGVEMLIEQAAPGFELWTGGEEFQTKKIKNILLK
ncbi:type I 3-dehydroquinate dehydratase [Candidatus Gracilibacteria bacterium]|nr:type I 3-dehydroquinate dehydratase [Candidatus Gracilibacteria bacterium]